MSDRKASNLLLNARQRAMLAEMGISVWTPPAARKRPPAAPAQPGQESTRQSPSAQTRPGGQTDKNMQTRIVAPAAMPPAPAPAPVHSSEELAHMDWQQLQTACAALAAQRRLVFGYGSTQADVMVIGEAPGEQEDLQGKPFVGPAGQLLDNMLAAIGLSRHAPEAPAFRGQTPAAAYITNAIKFRPSGNRNPSHEEIIRERPYLLRQIALLQPKVILALGRFAVLALLQSEAPIGRLRKQTQNFDGTPVVVSYHPAYLLRAPHEKAKAWQDLCRLRELLAPLAAEHH